MKVAVVKLGARISFNANDTSGGNGEARMIITTLAEGGAEVHAYTKILKKDQDPEHQKIIMHQIADEFEDVNNQGYDALLVINGNVNFFGGAEDREQILNYHIVNHFDGNVFYAHCDPALSFNQLWQAIEKKPWGGNYKKEDIFIDREVIVLHQPYNVEWLKEQYAKKNKVAVKEYIQFPFEQFPLLHERHDYNPNPKVDLAYGGTMRGGKREANLLKYYFKWPEEYSVELFGKIDAGKFKKLEKFGCEDESTWPSFGKAVKYNEMTNKMNESIAHIVIGDDAYTTCEMINQRTYESILAGNITFIDNGMDPQHRVYGNDPELSELLYVDKREDVEAVLKTLKLDPSTREIIVNRQWEAVGFDRDKYTQSLVNLIGNKL